jgi:hypothetical protein
MKGRIDSMTSRLLALAATLALLASCASGGKPSDKPSGGEQTLIELRAVVAGVDQQRRRVTLKSDDGGILVLPVAEEFSDFDKLRLGEAVIISYTEKISREVVPVDGGAAGASGRESSSTPKPGESPGGAAESAIKITAKITASIRRAAPSR